MTGEGGLVGFLRERLREDESVARRAAEGGDHPRPSPWRREYHGGFMHAVVDRDGKPLHASTIPTEQVAHIVRWDPKRALAEVDAKLRILDLCEPGAQFPDFDGGYETAWEQVLKLLALAHAEHPDYREEWAP